MQLAKFYPLSGLGLLVIGFFSGYFGYYKMMHCLQATQAQSDLTVGQFARGLMLPHIMVLAGIGSVVFGLIMVIRGLTLDKRLSSRE
jgi:hypothetical protein